MQTQTPPTGALFAIKRYALHDGPDLRVTVFFKGCPLACMWCHNPEGLRPGSEIHTTASRCVGCGECQNVCPQSALSQAPTVRDLTRCTTCGACVEVCPSLAHEHLGQDWSVDNVIAEIAKDAPFFEGTSGGVTFSGGEPLSQPDFLLALLRACGRRGWHRAVDTSGLAPWTSFEAILPDTDLFLFDLKHMDPAGHQLATGVDNALILDNARRLARRGAAVRFRMPLIPGINNDRTNLVRTAEFVRTASGASIDLLPYHDTARGKYAKLGLNYPGHSLRPAGPDLVDQAASILQDCGLSVRIGG